MNDETAVLALVERLEKAVKSEEELQNKVELEITVRKRLREELNKSEANNAEKDEALKVMEKMRVKQINLENSIIMLEQNLKTKEQ